MAYLAFPEISKRLGVNEQEPGVPNAPAGGGSLVGGPSAGAVGSGSTAEEARSKNPNAFLQANVGQSTDVTGGIRTQLDDAKKGISNSLNEWKSKLPGIQSVSDDDVSSAVGGNQDKFQQISNRLGGSYSAPSQYDYNPTAIKDAGLLTQGVRGTEQLLRQTQGPGYTQGMARMDARLNQMDPNYRQNINSVVQGIGGIQSDLQKARSDAGSLVEQNRGLYNAETEKLRNALSGIGSGIKTQAQKQASDYNASLDAAKNNFYSNGLSLFDDGRARSEYALNPGLSNYVQFGKAAAGPAYNQEQADRMNRISQLLGLGDSYSAANLGPTHTVDKSGYQAALTKAIEEGEKLKQETAARDYQKKQGIAVNAALRKAQKENAAKYIPASQRGEGKERV